MEESHVIKYVRRTRLRRFDGSENGADFGKRATAERLKRLRAFMPESKTFEKI